VHGTPDAPGQTLRLLYLARGIAWAPSYALDLIGENRLRLSAKAEIINQLEDLEGVEASLVTGYPNFRFAGVDDPMGQRGDLATFLNALQNPPGAADQGRGGVMNQMLLSDERDAGYLTGAGGPAEGETLEELFFYPVRGLTLRRGERAYVPLFDLEAACEHLYELHPGDLLGAESPPQDRAAQRPPAEDVWHSVRVTNPGEVPWTSAPAAVFRDGRLLAQDVLSYAPRGGATTVRVSKALDIRAEAVEREVERTRNSATLYGYSYDLVEVEGRIVASSHRDRDVTLSVVKDVTGDVVSSAPAAAVEKTARRLRAVNAQSVLRWQLALKARGRIEVVYRYRILLRS
jgi:hypothetical protein